MISRELLTVNQLADRLHIRPRTVKAWVQLGRIPVLRLSPKVLRFSWQAVVFALSERLRSQHDGQT
jgi:hypothetical protein